MSYRHRGSGGFRHGNSWRQDRGNKLLKFFLKIFNKPVLNQLYFFKIKYHTQVIHFQIIPQVVTVSKVIRMHQVLHNQVHGVIGILQGSEEGLLACTMPKKVKKKLIRKRKKC